jgi:hypothetical protein
VSTSELCPQCFELLDNGRCECGYRTDERRDQDAGFVSRFQEIDVRPTLDVGDLWGEGGNAFVVMAAVSKGLCQMKVEKEVAERVIAECKSGDYIHLLRTADKVFKLDVHGYENVEEFIDHYEHGQEPESSSGRWKDTDGIPDDFKFSYNEALKLMFEEEK